MLRLSASGAYVLARLTQPLDTAKACLVSQLNPIAARVLLGPMKHHGFDACELDIVWPANIQVMPPPVRFQRKKFTGAPEHKTKRRKF